MENGDPRVFLAIERTFLAWTRTALALMGFGFVVARLGLFLRELVITRPESAVSVDAAGYSGATVLGLLLLAAGLIVQGGAILEHFLRVRAFQNGRTVAPMRASFATVVGVFVIVAGGGAAYLIASR